MTLQVPFDGFAQAAHQVAGVKVVFVTKHPKGALVSCANPNGSVHVIAIASISPEEAKEVLQKAKLEVFEGLWTDDPSLDLEGDPLSKSFVAAVSYVSADHMPGLWVDAMPEQFTQIQVLKNMYEEFRTTGEVGDVAFEEFVRLANPNVVIVSATQLRGYVLSKLQQSKEAG